MWMYKIIYIYIFTYISHVYHMYIICIFMYVRMHIRWMILNRARMAKICTT